MCAHWNSDAEITCFSSPHYVKEKENTYSSKQKASAGSETPPHKQKCVKSCFLFCLFIYFLYFNVTLQARFHMHTDSKGLGRLGGSEEDEMLVQAKAALCVSRRTEAYTGSRFQSFWPTGCRSPRSLVHFTWKRQWRRMASVFSGCLCLLPAGIQSFLLPVVCLTLGGWQRGGVVFSVMGWCGVAFQTLDASSCFFGPHPELSSKSSNCSHCKNESNLPVPP